MAKHDHMSHVGPDGADMGKRLTMAGYHYRVAAENVGVGQKTLAEVVEGWKKSPPHSRNMLLADAKHMGIALRVPARHSMEDVLDARHGGAVITVSENKC